MLIRFLPLWLCVFVFAVGCRPKPVADAPKLGRFEGEVVAVWNDDGRHMTLREDFAYIDAMNRRWLARAGTTVDGASIPRAFWTIVGGPFEGRYRNASVIHDVGCVEMSESWEDVHRTFYEACLTGGVDEAHAKVLYYAVYHFGPRWKPVTEKRVEWRATESGEMVQEEVVVNRVVRDDPLPPTPEEIEQVTEFVVEDNPNPDFIEQIDRETLRRRPRGERGRRDLADDGSTDPRPPRQWEQRSDGERVARSDREDYEGDRSRRRGGENGNDEARGQRPERREWTEEERQRYAQRREWSEEERQRYVARRQASAAQGISPQEQDWAVATVRQHLEQQASQSLTAEYAVERLEDGYRVFVQFLQVDELGEVFAYPGGSCAVTISREGEVLEVVSGA